MTEKIVRIAMSHGVIPRANYNQVRAAAGTNAEDKRRLKVLDDAINGGLIEVI